MDDDNQEVTGKSKIESSTSTPKTDSWAALQHQEKLLRQSILQSLGKGEKNKQAVADNIEKIEQIRKILHWQKETYLGNLAKGIAIFLLVLVALAVVPSNTFSMSTPGYINVNAMTIKVVLAEDLDWSGNIEFSANIPLSLSQFDTLNSPNHPEISLPLEAKFAKLSSSQGGVLSTLYLPKGTKVWIDWDSVRGVLKIDAIDNMTHMASAKTASASFKMFGQVHANVGGNIEESRTARKCPRAFESCRIPRVVNVSGLTGNGLSLSLPLSNRFQFDNFIVESLSFSDFELNHSPKNRLRCSMQGGHYKLRGDLESTIVSQSDCLSVISQPSRLSIDGQNENALNVEFFGQVESLLVGSPEFNDERVPNMLNWLLAVPGVKDVGALFAAILATFGLILSIVGIKK